MSRPEEGSRFNKLGLITKVVIAPDGALDIHYKWRYGYGINRIRKDTVALNFDIRFRKTDRLNN
jgi:hypothetical protein